MLFIVIIINTENQLNQLNEAINYKRLSHKKKPTIGHYLFTHRKNSSALWKMACICLTQKAE